MCCLHTGRQLPRYWKRGTGPWIASHSDWNTATGGAHFYGPLAAKVVQLFGTPVIATPYGNEARAKDVLDAIRHLNPGVEVTLA